MPRSQNSRKAWRSSASPRPRLRQALRVADHPDEAAAVPPGLAARVRGDALSVPHDEPEALVVVGAHLPPLLERQRTEAPLVRERLPDGVVELPRFLLAERVHGDAVGARRRRLLLELDRHLPMAASLAIAAATRTARTPPCRRPSCADGGAGIRAPGRAALSARRARIRARGPWSSAAPPRRRRRRRRAPPASRPRAPCPSSSSSHESSSRFVRIHQARTSCSPIAGRGPAPLVLLEQLRDERRVVAAQRPARDAVRRASSSSTSARATRVGARAQARTRLGLRPAG